MVSLHMHMISRSQLRSAVATGESPAVLELKPMHTEASTSRFLLNFWAFLYSLSPCRETKGGSCPEHLPPGSIQLHCASLVCMGTCRRCRGGPT